MKPEPFKEVDYSKVEERILATMTSGQIKPDPAMQTYTERWGTTVTGRKLRR